MARRSTTYRPRDLVRPRRLASPAQGGRTVTRVDELEARSVEVDARRLEDGFDNERVLESIAQQVTRLQAAVEQLQELWHTTGIQGYYAARLQSGSVVGDPRAYNLRLVSIGTVLVFEFEEPMTTEQYTILAGDRSAFARMYSAALETRSQFEIRAYDDTGSQIDLSVGTTDMCVVAVGERDIDFEAVR